MSAVGILALQGAVQPHAEKLKSLGVTPVEVRTPEQLSGLSGIILPGGESTTMIHLLKLNRLWEPLLRFVSERPTLGVCAGAILLAKHVQSPAQESLGVIDITVERNAYGRQLSSFIDQISPTEFWMEKVGVEGVFIRAPKIAAIHGKVKPLFTWKEEIVMAEEGNVIAATFHPELTESLKIHEYFLSKQKG